MRNAIYIGLLSLLCATPAVAHETCDQPEVEVSYTPDLLNGKRIYKRHCVQCHESNGEGYNTKYAPDWRKDTSRLNKSDEELLKSINDGIGTPGTDLWIMPPWGRFLIEEDQQDVLAYIRNTFQNKE